MVNNNWTPILSADGVHYCSPSCGGGKFCTKEQYDLAVERSNKLAADLGEGWEPHVWENLGWHYSVHNGDIKIHAHHYKVTGETSYTAWIEPGAKTGNKLIQIIESSSDPHEALGIAKQKAWDMIHRIRATLTDLEEKL